MANASEPEVRAAVAKNPNTPQAALFRLWREFPGAFLQNPLVPLLSLEDANFIQKASGKMFVGLLSLEEVSHRLAPRAPADLLEKIAHQPYGEQFFESPCLSARGAFIAWGSMMRGKHRIHQRRVAVKVSKRAAQKILCDLLASEALLREISLVSEPLLRAAVAGHPNTPVDVLGALSTDVDGFVRCAVARHLGVPGEVLARLAGDSSGRIGGDLIYVGRGCEPWGAYGSDQERGDPGSPPRGVTAGREAAAEPFVERVKNVYKNTCASKAKSILSAAPERSGQKKKWHIKLESA